MLVGCILTFIVKAVMAESQVMTEVEEAMTSHFGAAWIDKVRSWTKRQNQEARRLAEAQTRKRKEQDVASAGRDTFRCRADRDLAILEVVRDPKDGSREHLYSESAAAAARQAGVTAREAGLTTVENQCNRCGKWVLEGSRSERGVQTPEGGICWIRLCDDCDRILFREV